MRSYNDIFDIPAAVGDHPNKTPLVTLVTLFHLSIHFSICHCDTQISRPFWPAFLIVIENFHVLIFLLHETILYLLHLGLYFDTGYNI